MSRVFLTAIPVLAALCLPLSSIQAETETETETAAETGVQARAGAVDQSGRQFVIDSVSATSETTPRFPGPTGKTSRMQTSWMQIEVTFHWQNRARTGADGQPLSDFLDELEVEVYALLSTRVSVTEQAALLAGKTTLLHVPQEDNLAAAVYISPRLLDQLFNGRAPSTANGALVSRDTLGAALRYKGQVVATFPVLRAGQAPFWEDVTVVRLPEEAVRKVEDGILPRWKTPFAFSNWDFYQQEKVGE